jgi:hypothetical protein
MVPPDAGAVAAEGAAGIKFSGGGGGGGGGGPPAPGIVGATGAEVGGGDEAVTVGELVPMKVSAGPPCGFHLIPCGKCFRTYFCNSLNISMNELCHSLWVSSPLR